MLPQHVSNHHTGTKMEREDFDLDVNNMQADLESLKDILSGQISLDNTMVSSLFDAENGDLPTL